MLHSSLQEGSSACNFKIIHYNTLISTQRKLTRTSYRNNDDNDDGQNIWPGFSPLHKL